MTRANLDLQTQLEQNTKALTIVTFFNDYPVLFLESMYESSTNPLEQVEYHNTSPKDQTPPETIQLDQSRKIPSPPKKENLKDPASFPSPIYPPIMPTKRSFSTIRDDHLIPTLFMTVSLSKHNSLLCICIQLNTRTHSMVKTYTFSYQLHQKSCLHTSTA